MAAAAAAHDEAPPTDDYVSRISRGVPPGTALLNMTMAATVVKGFGRGSKLLGIPTANMCMKEVGKTVDPMATGIYCGFARLGREVYKAVVSIGWNPYFENKEKTVEPHLLHDFGGLDFYGETLHLRICSYIRPEMNFQSLDDLIRAIHGDIAYAHRQLQEPEYAAVQEEMRAEGGSATAAAVEVAAGAAAGGNGGGESAGAAAADAAAATAGVCSGGGGSGSA